MIFKGFYLLAILQLFGPLDSRTGAGGQRPPASWGCPGDFGLTVSWPLLRPLHVTRSTPASPPLGRSSPPVHPPPSRRVPRRPSVLRLQGQVCGLLRLGGNLASSRCSTLPSTPVPAPLSSCPGLPRGVAGLPSGTLGCSLAVSGRATTLRRPSLSQWLLAGQKELREPRLVFRNRRLGLAALFRLQDRTQALCARLVGHALPAVPGVGRSHARRVDEEAEVQRCPATVRGPLARHRPPTSPAPARDGWPRPPRLFPGVSSDRRFRRLLLVFKMPENSSELL